MLFARLARWAILADAPATTKAQRTQKRRPETRRFASQPVRNIRRRFRINMLHMKNVILCTCTAQEKRAQNRAITHILKGEMRFATETSLVSVAKRLNLWG